MYFICTKMLLVSRNNLLIKNISQFILYKIITYVFFTQIYSVSGTIDETNRVHFRIHLPEIINHHIHTKMVYIHEDDGKELPEEHTPQQQGKPYDEETYLENWSSWNNNGHIGGHHRSKLHKHKHINGHHNYPDFENGIYMKDGQGEDIVGFTYPPQYAEDVPHNDIESYMEDTYKHGVHSESGLLLTNNHDNFFDVNQEEAELSDHDYYHDEHNNRDLHSHHHYDKEIGHEDRIGKHANNRKYFVIRMIPR